jgi:hypothetical protein
MERKGLLPILACYHDIFFSRKTGENKKKDYVRTAQILNQALLNKYAELTLAYRASYKGILLLCYVTNVVWSELQPT